MSLAAAEILRGAIEAYRPLEPLDPSAFAARYRDVAGGPFAGPWNNSNAPYLIDVMDSIKEAIESGRYLVLMKPAQAGGTDAIAINGGAWLMTYYPGPYLYLTTRDDTASELSRDRWDHVLRTCEPLKKKHLAGKAHGELILVKRFTDGKLVLSGLVSPNNYISSPYRGVLIDEIESARQLPDGSDPVATLEQRLKAFREGGATIMISFAHPTTDDHGAGKLFYELSDQRRAHVECPHCHRWWAPLWKHVQVFPREGQSRAAAERDPTCYAMVSECCGVMLTEADRLRMIENVRQVSTLSPEIAKTKKWIGLHFWSFFMRSSSVRVMAEEYVAALDEPGKMIAFVNKTCGDVHRAKDTQEVSVDAWERLVIPEGSDGAYARGEIPPEVQWLTSGQDSNERELHWSVWGWGFVRALEGHLFLNGWLIDWGLEEGPNSAEKQLRGVGAKNLTAQDLMIFDTKIYGQSWLRREDQEPLFVFQGFHDSGWMKDGVYVYCASRRDRSPEGGAFPSRGAAEDDHSSAPFVKWKTGLTYRVGEHEIADDAAKRAELNTYSLKVELQAFTDRRFSGSNGVPRFRLSLPHDVPGEFLKHLAAERLEKDQRGRKRWIRHGPNHWLDTLVMAYAAAWNVSQSVAEKATRGEQLLVRQAAERAKEQSRRRGRSGGDSAYRINTNY